MLKTAIQFGLSLDKDEFVVTKKLLSPYCKYIIGNDTLIGPDKICQSYEENMIAGRKKLDVLEWGQSRIEPINNNEFFVHFTDYLTHKGEKYTHTCKQKLVVNEKRQIILIEHIHNLDEQERLDNFYKIVGLKT